MGVAGFEDGASVTAARVRVRNLLVNVSRSSSGGQRVKLGGTQGGGG